MDRGGPIPTFAAPRQQQFGDQHVATPPPPTRADGQPGGPPSAHPSAQARGGGCGMTVKQRQQQQQTPARSPTEQARLANCLYRQCVAAGLWAKISVEQRPDGEHISFFSRPSAAASTAARAQEEVGPRRRRRRPNQKRRLKKKLWMQSCDQLRQPSRPTATPVQSFKPAASAAGGRRCPGHLCSDSGVPTRSSPCCYSSSHARGSSHSDSGSQPKAAGRDSSPSCNSSGSSHIQLQPSHLPKDDQVEEAKKGALSGRF